MTSKLAVDLPPVPRPSGHLAAIVYAAFGAVVLTAVVTLAALGRDGNTTERGEVPSSVRASPGGYRSFHFWHSGYMGGK